LKRTATTLLIIVLTAFTIGPKTVPVQATVWGSPGAIPGSDQYANSFPKLLQASNGTVWMVWEKVVTSYGQVYLMVNNGFGWSGQIPLVNSNGAFDDITPALAQLINGTIILVWSRGGPGGTGGCFGANTYGIYSESYTNGKWSTPTVVVQTPGDNITPALSRLKDGRVMMVWSRCTPSNGKGDLYYEIYNGAWGPENLLVGTTTFEEKLPGITQTADGNVWVIYSSNTATGNVNQLWDMVWNGTTWTSPAIFTNTTADDDWASLALDRNRTLWVFWARYLPNGTISGVPVFQYDLFYKNSTDNGLTWGPEQAIAPNINSDDRQPFVIQTSTSKKLWMVYSSNQQLSNPFRVFNLYLITSDIVKIHDLAATSVSPPPSLPLHRVGDMMNLSVTVANLGDYSESSKINCYANSTIIYGQPFTVAAGQTSTVTVIWNSTTSLPGYLMLRASILPVPGEFLSSNNSVNASTVFPLSFRGDVNRDGRVDITDLTLVSSHFGAIIGTPNYYAEADLNHDGVINIVDLSMTAADFGKTFLTHDLAVVSITRPSITPRIGEIVKVSTIVTNIGGYAETTQVRLYLNSTLTSSLSLNLSPGQSTTLMFSWNATGLRPGRYVMMVSIVPVPGELVTSNNSMNSTIVITFRGDVNRDGKVDIVDLTLVASHFGAVLGSPSYYPEADLNHDGVIDIADMAICSADFGKSII